jgi:hypothetical protein
MVVSRTHAYLVPGDMVGAFRYKFSRKTNLRRKLFRYIRDHGNRKGKSELARENAMEQPKPRDWWTALWKEEMTGIGTVGKVIGGAPIDPHLLEGKEAAGGASTSAAGAIGRAEGGARLPPYRPSLPLTSSWATLET